MQLPKRKGWKSGELDLPYLKIFMLAIAIILVSAIVSNYQFGVSTEGVTLKEDTTKTTPAGFQQYTLRVETLEITNPLDGTSATPTAGDFDVYLTDGKRLSDISTLYGASGTSIGGEVTVNIPIDESTGDFLWVGVDTGTAHYPDPAQLKSDNKYITDWKWMPVSSANVPELVVEVQLSKLGEPNYQVDPNLRMKMRVPAIADDLGVTMSAPSDQSNIGTTSSTDIYVDWDLTGLSANQAFDFAKIWVQSNQLTSVVELEEMTIDSSSYIIKMSDMTNEGDSMTIWSPSSTSQTTGITNYWVYWPLDESISNDYTNTLLIPRGSSHADKISIRLHAKTSFALTDYTMTMDLYVRLISAANGLQTQVTDSMNLNG